MCVFNYEAVVFDFDGTLIQSNDIKTSAFGKLYEEYGETIVKKVISYQKNNEGVSRFVKFKYWHENLLHQKYTNEIGKKLSYNFSKIIFNLMINAKYVDGALNFLRKYHKKIPLFVASGTPENELRKIIFNLSIKHFFRGIYGSPATKEQILQSIIKKNNFTPTKILMVGDTISDLNGAENAGTKFIGVETKNNKRFFSSSIILIQNIMEIEKHIF